MKKEHIQQGDVLFLRVNDNAVPETATRVKSARPGLVTFAEGEVTGHHHSAPARGAALLEGPSGERWCVVKKKTTVKHQTHGPVVLDPGTYKVGIVVEVNPFSEEVHMARD